MAKTSRTDIILPGDPTAPLHAVPKQYSDRLIPYIPDNGCSMFASGGVETAPRFNSSAYSGVSGQLWASYFTATASTPLTRLAIATADIVTAGATLARLALFTAVADDSITKVAQTANDPTIGNSAYTVSERVLSTVGGFPASYTLVPGTRYALGWLQVATTPCKVSGVYVTGEGTAPVPSRVIASQTDIAASYAVANLSAFSFVMYLRGRP